MDIFILDLVGVFAFAVLGAAKALRQSYNASGIFLCAFLTALAGGTIREVTLGHAPFYFYNYAYIIVVIFATIIAIGSWRWFAKIKKYLLVADAIGLATFAYIGAHAAWTAHAGPVAIVGFAVLTAAGGGIIADLVAGQKPSALSRDFYIPPAALLALVFVLLGELATSTLTAYILISMTTLLRLGWLYTQHHKRKIKNRLFLLRRYMRLSAILGHD